MAWISPFGERYRTLVAAAFRDRQLAESAALQLRREFQATVEVSVVGPTDPQVARKLEPDSRGIWRTVVRGHHVFGAGGVAVGLAVAWLLVGSSSAAAMSPGFTALFAGVVGAFLGMMVAGLLTLRPDHSLVIRKVRERLQQGQWEVVVHPTDRRLAKNAVAALQDVGGEPVRSF